MWNYKGFKLPWDIPMLIGILALLIYYSIVIQLIPIEKILKKFKRIKARHQNQRLPNADERSTLDKMWKGCGFFLKRALQTDKPCLRRTLVLYRWCCRRGIRGEIAIGVSLEGRGIKGHSWLLIDGVPFRENMDELGRYTIMMEG